MDLLDAVEVALNKIGQPRKYTDLTSQIIEEELWHPRGKTPAATVNAALSVDIVDNGVNSRFQRTAPGIFALRCWNLEEYVPPKGKQKDFASITVNEPANNLSNGLSSDTQNIKKKLFFSDAAEYILEHYADKKPMYYKDIAKKASSLELLSTVGATPEATMYALILTEIKRANKRGKTPRFVTHGKGMVGLIKWLPTPLIQQIDHFNKGIRSQLHEKLMSMSPQEFEILVGRLLEELGFNNVEVTKLSGDGGIDVRGTLVVGDVIRTNMAIQVKRWKNNVQSVTVQQVRGSLNVHEQGLIITTSDFSSGAIKEANKSNAIPVALMNGEQLIDLLIEHGIGAHKGSAYLLELGDSEED